MQLILCHFYRSPTLNIWPLNILGLIVEGLKVTCFHFLSVHCVVTLQHKSSNMSNRFLKVRQLLICNLRVWRQLTLRLWCFGPRSHAFYFKYVSKAPVAYTFRGLNHTAAIPEDCTFRHKEGINYRQTKLLHTGDMFLPNMVNFRTVV
jgi:hypothetical protein